MKLSTNTIKFVNQRYNSAGDPAQDGAQALATRIGAQLGAIDEVIDFGSKYEGVIIVRVASCEPHPNADKLKVCKIDDGGVAQTVERDENGLVQVVCGAPNVREGLLVAWLPPGATVPESVGKDPFVLEARALRGVISNGMLASARELALGDSHDGILEIAQASDESVRAGTLFIDAYNLRGDVIFDIENKMFTHRPDCFGFLGLAREIEGIHNRPYKSPTWYRMDAEIPAVEAEPLGLEVRNELPELVPRFMAIALRDVEVKPSPMWLQVELARYGIRSINNIVDYTNFFMLETGQPLHAYDYDKLVAQDVGVSSEQATIVVRHPRSEEKILLLNGKEIEPRAEAIMIASASKAIGVGGVMGGGDTEVDERTKNIVIEVATFDMYSIRRTSMAHGLFTDAVTRFNKGQSPLQNRAVLAKVVDEIRKFAGGKVASEVVDINHVPETVMERQSIHAPVTLTAEFINERLGLHLTLEAIAQLLTNVEFDVVINHDDLGSVTVKAPFWRTDIEIPEDVVEEVGRLYGFDHLPLELPTRPIIPAQNNPNLDLKQTIRDILSRAGANEVLSYSFVHGRLLEKVGQKPEQAYRLANALSPDLQYFRLSVTPSLLERVHPNIKAGYGEFALFEIGKVHIKDQIDGEGLPREFERISLVFAADDKTAKMYDGAAYYQARLYLDTLLQALHLEGDVTFEFQAEDDADVAASYYAPGRVAIVKIGDVVVGRLGEYAVAVRKALKLPEFCAGFELSTSALLSLLSQRSAYVPLSSYPLIEQDICLKVGSDVLYAQVYELVAKELDKLKAEAMRVVITPVDIYQRAEDAAHKQITLRVSVVDYDKTLRDSEVTAMLEVVARVAHEQLQAERV